MSAEIMKPCSTLVKIKIRIAKYIVQNLEKTCKTLKYIIRKPCTILQNLAQLCKTLQDPAEFFVKPQKNLSRTHSGISM